MKLYNYFRSSAAYRVRIAMAINALARNMGYPEMIREGKSNG